MFFIFHKDKIDAYIILLSSITILFMLSIIMLNSTYKNAVKTSIFINENNISEDYYENSKKN